MNSTRPPLAEWQRSKLCAVLALGCSRTSACAFAEVAPARFEEELAADEAFGAAVARAEAEPELRHMGNIHRAAQSEKNWRTSAWWLMQRLRSESKRDAGVATAGHLAQLVDDLAAAIVAEVPDVGVQRRLIERLRRILAGETPASAAASVVIDSPFRLVVAPRGDETSGTPADRSTKEDVR